MVQEGRIFDFEERTLLFSKRIVTMSKSLPYREGGMILIKQCLRSGTSIGTNYREANDALGDKDFLYRLRIARKEAKETTYWLELIMEYYTKEAYKIQGLVEESIELTKILSTMIRNKKSKV